MTNREVDALVSKTIMRRVACQCDHTKTVSPRFSAQTGDCLSCGSQLGGSYSTDPAASKAMRDKMRADGWLYRITVNNLRCDVVFQRGTVNCNWGYAEHHDETEELAFALAALRAVGVEV